MSACTRCRWGTGTTTEKYVDTEASLEMKARLASIQQERAQLDSMWSTSVTEESTALVVKEEIQPKKINTQIKTSKEIHSLADLKAERERQDNLWK
jgi:hypothetical protein